MTSNTSPITTAREALIDIRTARNFGHNTAAEAITAALDYAEKLKIEDEILHAANAEFSQAAIESHAEVLRLTSQLEQAEKVVRAQEKALKLHHTWQGSDEPYGLELTPGNWIELNRSAEYADSSMYEVTMDAIRAASQWIKDRQAKGEG